MSNAQPIFCTHCGSEIKSNSKFCSKCGNSIVSQPTKAFCHVCGEELGADENFCHKCGSASTQVRNNIALENISAYNNQISRATVKPTYTPPQPVRSQYSAPPPAYPQYNMQPDYVAPTPPPKAPKVKKISTIKDFSICAIISWILLAIAGVIFADYAFSDLAALSAQEGYAWRLYPLIANSVSAISLILAAVFGSLFWKENKKLRVLPSILSAIGIISSAISTFIYGTELADFLTIGIIFVVLLITFLYSIKAIKNKALVLSLIIPFSVLGLIGYAFGIISDVVNFGTMYDTSRIWLDASHAFTFPFLYIVLLALLLLPFSLVSKKVEPEHESIDDDKIEESEEKIESTKKFNISIIKKYVSIALVLIVVIVGAFWAYNQVWTTVDNVIERSADDVLDDYQRFISSTGYEYSDTVEEGYIISQSVEAGTKISIYDRFSVMVSKGAGVKIPEVVNTPLSSAQQVIKDLGLSVTLNYVYSDKIAKNNIVEISSYHVDEGANVTLDVSMGPDLRVEVPSVVGLTESAATSALKKSGFKVTVTYSNESCDAYKTESEVKSQSLTGKQDPGSTIAITVAKPSINVTKVTFDQNSVGGVDVSISFKNTSNKQIKYVKFTARYKNSVGDDVYCSIWNSPTKVLSYTGPLNAGKSDTVYWDATIYNWTCSRIYFDSIEVTFMDGTTHTMSYHGYWYK